MRSLLAAMLGLAGLAPAAPAADVHTVRQCDRDDYGRCTYLLQARYVAAPGEANDLVIDRVDDGFVFRDATGIRAGAGCTAAGDGAVACRAYDARVSVGDHDDAVRSAPGVITVDGGPGNDDLSGSSTLFGGEGDDRLTGRLLSGGEGADVLTGSAQEDRLDGGPGIDTVSALDGYDLVVGSADGDALSGGGGQDTVDYRGHIAPLRLDLRTGTAGGDRIDGFEHMRGGAGDDILVGDDGDNALWGELGRDTLLGGGGDDGLYGHWHRDVLDGGPGADLLEGQHGLDRYAGGPGDDELIMYGSRVPETLDCGAGRDDVRWPGLALLLPNCELVEGLPAHPRLREDGSLTFAIPSERGDRSVVTLRVRGRTRPFAARRYVGNGRTRRVRLHVPDRVRRLSRRPVPIEVRLGWPWDPTFGLRWVIDLPR